MSIRNVNLTVEQETIIQAIALQTGRTVETLLQNYLEGFIGSLRDEALRPAVDTQFLKLSLADKEKALVSVGIKVFDIA